jgi:hypothetical protein
VRPDLDKTQVLEILRRSARDLAPAGRDPDTGYGMLDIPAALALPAPIPDPLEPNDDVTMVTANGMFSRAKAPLTAPGRLSADISGRLDPVEDSEDVYRVWVPRRHRLTVTLTSSSDVDLELWRPATRTVQARGWLRRQHLAAAARQGTGSKTVSTVNRGRSGAHYYVNPFLREGMPLAGVSYNVSVKAQPAKGSK